MVLNHALPQSYRDIFISCASSQDLLNRILAGILPFPFSGKCGLLLHGPNGTGKTTLANFLPVEIDLANAGSNSPWVRNVIIQHGSNGISEIKDIVNFCQTVPNGKYNYVVLDEVDQLSVWAMDALKGAMLIPNSVFIMTTNQHNKISQGVKSRSHEIKMHAPDISVWIKRIRDVLLHNGMVHPITDEELGKQIASYNGDARAIMTHAAILASHKQIIKVQAVPPPSVPPQKATTGGWLFSVNNGQSAAGGQSVV